MCSFFNEKKTVTGNFIRGKLTNRKGFLHCPNSTNTCKQRFTQHVNARTCVVHKTHNCSTQVLHNKTTIKSIG